MLITSYPFFCELFLLSSILSIIKPKAAMHIQLGHALIIFDVSNSLKYVKIILFSGDEQLCLRARRLMSFGSD